MKVSVIVVCTDRVEKLLDSINSALNQVANFRFEVIVIENNSKDLQVVSSLLSKLLTNGNLRHVYLPDCENANVARNFGAEIAEGEYVAYLDSDDEWECNHLSVTVAKLEDSSYSASFSPYKVVRSKLSKSVRRGYQLDKLDCPVEYLFSGGYAQTSSFVVKKTIFECVKWDENLRRNQDYDFFIKLHRYCGWLYIDKITVSVNWGYSKPRKNDLNSYFLFLDRYEREMSSSSRGYYYMCRFADYSKCSKSAFYALKERYYSNDELDNMLSIRFFSLNYYLTKYAVLFKELIK